MTDPIEFVKLSGSGNDFICIDNRDGRFDEMLESPLLVGHFALSLCSRGMGIGGDGIIFASNPDIDGVSDIAARFFEADGAEAELCGNGTACFVHWMFANGGIPKHEAKILTPAGVVRGSNSDGQYVRVCIPDPEDLQFALDLNVKGSSWNCDYAVTGVPHIVIYVDDVDKVDIQHWGPAFRYHEHFGARGVNANFVQVLGENQLAIRTWEFGVEGETLSCGTGSAAAAILAVRRFNWPVPDQQHKPVSLHARSGDTLRVFFTANDDDTVSSVCLETIVRFICCGTVHPDLGRLALDPQALPQPHLDKH